MANYFIKRIVIAAVTLFIVATLTFFLMYLVPGGPFLAEKAPSEATLAALEAKYGLDQPIIIQYKNYMLRLLQGDLGTSLKQRGREINDIIFSRLPVSARIGGLAALVAVFMGVVMGSLAALNRGSGWIASSSFSRHAASPCPVSSCVRLLMYFVGVKLDLRPRSG
jgi:oligopeptide transport system permease protein